MAVGFLQLFPDPATLLRVQGDTETGVRGLLSAFDALPADRGGSPLAGVVAALAQVRAAADIDVSALSTQLPATLDALRDALPTSALEYVEDIEQAYAAARSFLTDNPLVSHIAQGSSLQDTALAVIEDALTRFESGLTQLAGNLIDPHTIDAVRSALAEIETFRTDYSGHREQFLPFLSQNVLGVSPDVLRAPLDNVQAALGVLAPLDAAALAQTLGPAGSALADADAGLRAALADLDPAATEGYAAIQTRLDALDAAVSAADTALTGIYATLGDLVDKQAWAEVFTSYRAVLDTVDIGQVPTIDDVIGALIDVLEEILGRLFTVLDADDLTARVGLLVQSVDDAVATSGLARAHDAVADFLDEIRVAVQAVPTDAVAHAVQAMLTRVKTELDSLGIEAVAQRIEAAFDQVDQVVGQYLTTTLVDEVKKGLDAVLSAVGNLPVDRLAGELNAAITQLSGLVAEIAAALKGPVDQASAFSAQLEGLSFKPVADDVVSEIDDVRGRLAAIQPSALSEPERLALQAALAVLRGIDLEGTVVAQLKAGFGAAKDEVAALLADLGRVLDQVRAHVAAFDPDKALQPLDALLGRAADEVRQANATVLLRPLQALADEAAGALDHVSPARLLAPLQAPYDSLLAAVQRVDPAQWVAPLRSLYAEIDRLIGLVDVTPLLEELDRRRRDLLAHVRSTLLDALTGLQLPPPLDALLAAVRPFVEAITDTLFGGDVATEVQALSTNLRSGLDLATPLRLLDAPFDELQAMLDAVPQDAVIEAFEALRTSVGAGLDVLDPRAVLTSFRAGETALAALAAPAVLAAPLRLPGLRAAFDAQVAAAPPERAADVAAVRAHISASFALVDPAAVNGVTARLATAHADVTARLARGIAALDPAAVEGAYAKVRADLDRLVPNFLRATAPLTPDQVRVGLAALRPSTKAAPLEAVVQRFLAQAQPLQDGIGDAVGAVFGALGKLVAMVDPLALRDAVAAIYQAVRSKARVLDPDALATSLRDDFFTPVLAPLRALDPAALGARLDQSFTRAVAALRDGVRAVLDALGTAVDEKLRGMREAVEQVIATVRTTLASAGAAVAGVVRGVEELALVDLVPRLEHLIDNLQKSFDAELDRVRAAFDDMLAAIPIGGGGARASAASGA